jgi:hypothetical protein
VTAMTRGPSFRSGQALETIQNFSSHSTSPQFPSRLRATAPASLSSTISGSGLWNGTGEMHRWKTAEQIAAGILGARGPWSNGAQATSRPHLRMSLWFRSVETWASLSGHRPPDAVLNSTPCRTSRNRTSVWQPRGGPKSAPPPTSTIFPNKHQNWNVEKRTHVCQRCWLSRLAVSIPCCISKFGVYCTVSQASTIPAIIFVQKQDSICGPSRIHYPLILLFDSAAKFGVAMEHLF